MKEVLPNKEQNFNKEKGIEEASLITAVDVKRNMWKCQIRSMNLLLYRDRRSLQTA
ncbi:hypothetical protein T08_16788 [Trichinella sp. T8]|nr:hypothetical protein T08_16788 [Trichinella sp. T8]